jgi:hypothetical protein
MAIELRNKTELKFTDISSEIKRTYIFPDTSVEISCPQWLSVSTSGGHRILDALGDCWYIPPTWIAIRWEVADDQPHFVK